MLLSLHTSSIVHRTAPGLRMVWPQTLFQAAGASPPFARCLVQLPGGDGFTGWPSYCALLLERGEELLSLRTYWVFLLLFYTSYPTPASCLELLPEF